MLIDRREMLALAATLPIARLPSLGLAGSPNTTFTVALPIEWHDGDLLVFDCQWHHCSAPSLKTDPQSMEPSGW